MNLIQLLVSLEKHFGIRIPLEELQIEDVRSIESIARLVENHKLAHANAKGA
jgi:acyl carrier protein